MISSYSTRIAAIALAVAFTIMASRMKNAIGREYLSYVDAVMSDDPVGYWRFEERSRDRLLDSTRNGLDGEYWNTVLVADPGAIETGRGGIGASFQDEGGGSFLPHATVNSNPKATGFADNATFEVWLKPDNLKDDRYYEILSSSPISRDIGGYRLFRWGGSLTFESQEARGGGVTSDDFLTAGEWQHVVVVFDDQRQTSFYRNGNRDRSATIIGTDPIDPNDDPLVIGARSLFVSADRHGWVDFQNVWDGSIDEVAIYPRALTSEEIQEHYYAATVFPPLNDQVSIPGGCHTYKQNFDLGLGSDGNNVGQSLPTGWVAAERTIITGAFPDQNIQPGKVYNAGGLEESFSNDPPFPFQVGFRDLNGDGIVDAQDQDGASDRSLAVGTSAGESSQFDFFFEIADKELRAFRLYADFEVWGGGMAIDSAEFAIDITADTGRGFTQLWDAVGGGVEQVFPGDPKADSSLINGNDPANRAHYDSGLVELEIPVDATTRLRFSLDNTSDNDTMLLGLDNVVFRAVGAGDVDGNGTIEPLDIVELLKGGQFGKGPNGVTWQQGDFNGDDQFDAHDLIQVHICLAGEFPKYYAAEQGKLSQQTPEIVINSLTGEVTVDFAENTALSVVIDSKAGVFNTTATADVAWDTRGMFEIASAQQISNTLFSGTLTGVDGLGDLINAEFLGGNFDFNDDLTVKILVVDAGGVSNLEGHVIVVPEPSSSWLALMGLVCCGLWHWRCTFSRRTMRFSDHSRA